MWNTVDEMVSVVLALSVLVCYSLTMTRAAYEIPFDYINQSAWLYLDNSQCGGNRQSPIDIIVDDTIANPSYGALQMMRWSEPVSGQLLNTGKTVAFTPGRKDAVTVTQRGEYTIDQFHFHWGDTAGVGSEHRVNGVQFDGELHFVHSKTNPMPPAGSVDGDTKTVVAVFLRGVPTSVTAGSVWANLLNEIPQFNQNINISSVTLSDLLPPNLSYYYYQGSLTTPLCKEIVHFIVLQNPIEVPNTILNRLRLTPTENAPNGTNPYLTENFRDVQALNDRTVYRFNSASNCGPLVVIIMVCLLVVSSLL